MTFAELVALYSRLTSGLPMHQILQVQNSVLQASSNLSQISSIALQLSAEQQVAIHNISNCLKIYQSSISEISVLVKSGQVFEDSQYAYKAIQLSLLSLAAKVQASIDSFGALADSPRNDFDKFGDPLSDIANSVIDKLDPVLSGHDLPIQDVPSAHFKPLKNKRTWSISDLLMLISILITLYTTIFNMISDKESDQSMQSQLDVNNKILQAQNAELELDRQKIEAIYVVADAIQELTEALNAIDQLPDDPVDCLDNENVSVSKVQDQNPLDDDNPSAPVLTRE